MTDLHIHILPGLDDGASSWEDALEMAQMAVESGVRMLAATSHANLPGEERRPFFQKFYKKFMEVPLPFHGKRDTVKRKIWKGCEKHEI